MKKNILYAQSGGVTSVLNASAYAVIETARKQGFKVYAAHNGISGVLAEDLIDTSKDSLKALRALLHTPGGAFGSCRYKLKDLEENPREYERLIDVFRAHDIGYFLYNGGGDSQDTAYKVSQISERVGYPLICIGIPKTIDNDLLCTDNCPGFGSVAKYIATATREVGLDLASMAATSTKVFILEVMGRHAGWVAASSGLASEQPGDAPHIILFPELIFDEARFLVEVDQCVKRHGHCLIVASEGIRDINGKFLSVAGTCDVFGHLQLGGVGPALALLVQNKLRLKHHWAVADYLQRSARHLASKTDVEQAYQLGEAAVKHALSGKNAIMVTIVRESSKPYRWSISHVPLAEVALSERKMPRDYISENGFHITPACRAYLEPLIQGEDYPPFKNGLPQFARLKNVQVTKKL